MAVSPPSPTFIAANDHGGAQTPKAVVMHATVTSDNAGTARAVVRNWNASSVKSSAHYVIDAGEVIQAVGDHTVAYHCGYNQNTIGVEMCDEQTGPATRWSDADSEAIIARSARIVGRLCAAYGIAPVRPSVEDLKRKGPHGVYGHNDSRLAFGNTTHSDPRDFPWSDFMAQAKAEHRRLTAPAPAPVRHSVLTWNVKTGRPWSTAVLPALKDMLADNRPDTVCLQECYDAPLLAGLIPGYGYAYQAYGFDPETPGYIEEHSANVMLVRDGVTPKWTKAYEMSLSWKGPQMGIMHDPRIHRRVTTAEDGELCRVVNVHGPFGAGPKAETLTWARAELEALAALGDPVMFIGDWNIEFAELVKAMGPKATVDGGAPDMVAFANCREVSSVRLGNYGSDHAPKMWTFEA